MCDIAAVYYLLSQ